MSFIYAEKYRDENVGVESVRIICDTKIIPDEYTSMQFSKVQSDCVSKYGIVKSTICNPQLCISYAGNNILFAARLFSKLWDMKSFENDEVSAIALDVHNEAAALHSTDDPNRYDDVEFPITYYHNGNFHIERVRQGTIERDLLLANIGSKDAFEVFQKGRLSLGGNVSKHTESVFQDVVAGCKDDSVGGRVVEIEYRDEVGTFFRHSIFSPTRAVFHFVKTALFCCPNAFHRETHCPMVSSSSAFLHDLTSLNENESWKVYS